MSASRVPARVSLLAVVFLFALPNNLSFGNSIASWALVSFHAPFWLLHGIFFVRVAAANEVVYELVAEPDQEPQAGGQQSEEAVEQAPEEAANPADLQGKPRSITPNLSIQWFIYVFVH